MPKMSCPSTSSRSPCIGTSGVYELDDWWSSYWPKCRGGDGVNKLLGMMVIARRSTGLEERTLRGHSRTYNASLPSTPVTPYTHVSSTTTTSTTSRTGSHTPAHQVYPSTPVDQYSRSLRTHRHGKQPARMAQVLQPLIQLSTAARPRTLHLVPPERVLPTAAAAASVGGGCGCDRIIDARNTACVRLPRLPVVLSRRLYTANATAVACTVHAYTAPTIAPYRYVSANPHTPQLSSGPYA